jgi:hypothetical protein
MHSSSTVRRALTLCALGFVVAVASPAAADTNPHAITFGLGYHSFVSDDFEDSGYEGAGMGNLSYAYTVNPAVDVTFDMRMTFASQDETIDLGGTVYEVDTDYSTKWFGPGVRYNFGNRGAQPFMQANLYFVTESLSARVDDIEASDSESGVGLGLQGGVDVPVSRNVSLPLQMNFLTSSPANDLTSVGFQAGVTFHFGGAR